MICGLWPPNFEPEMSSLVQASSPPEQDTCEECVACETGSLKQTPSFFDQGTAIQHNLASPPESPGFVKETVEMVSDDDCHRIRSYSSVLSSSDEQERASRQEHHTYSPEQQELQQCCIPIAPLPSSTSLSEPPSFPPNTISAIQDQASSHQHRKSNASDPLPTPRSTSPPLLDRYRRSVSQACRQRASLDSHRRLPRAVTPDLLPSSSKSRGRLYSPMAAGFARLGQKHRHSTVPQPQRQQLQRQRRISVSSLAVADKAAASASRSSELRESMALVAKMFEGAA